RRKAAQGGLPRMAGRRSGAGPGRRARVPLRRSRVSLPVAAGPQRKRRMSLLVKAQREGRDIVDVTPRSAGWRYVGFSAHRLAAGETITLDRAGSEVCIVV